MTIDYLFFLITVYISLPKFFACPSGYFEGLAPDLCYHPVKEPKTWFDAEYSCPNHLVSIDDGFFNGIFMGEVLTAFGEKGDSFWIGKTTLYQPGRWSWSDGSNGTFENWAEGHPKANKKQLFCLSVHLPDGGWYSEDCNLKKPYVCQVKQESQQSKNCVPKCPEGWVFLEKLGKCYLFDTKGDCLNFQEKREVCKSFAGDLISIHSEQENIALAGLMSLYTEKTSGYYFIGLHKENGIWKWVDGSTVNYTNWDVNEPQKSSDPKEEYTAAALSFGMDEKFKWHSFVNNFHCNDGTFCEKSVKNE